MDLGRIQTFWQARTAVSDPRIATNYRNDGRLQLDVGFISQYLTPTSRVLDLGAGTCTLTQEILPLVAEAVAVEKFEEFLKRVPTHSRLKLICSDVSEFESPEKFDVILLFGVVNYLTLEDEQTLYEKCARMLSSDGYFIVKNQCGIGEEVVVDKFSEELNCDYHARYPAVDEQESRLNQHFSVARYDIYPPQYNRWSNTHFYAFECRKQAC